MAVFISTGITRRNTVQCLRLNLTDQQSTDIYKSHCIGQIFASSLHTFQY